MKFTTMQAQQQPVSMQAYFNQKKVSTPDVIGVEGMCSMVFIDQVKCKGRGIRAWEKARYENYDRKMKQEQYYQDQRTIQKYKNQKTVDAYKEAERLKREREQKEQEEIAKFLKDQEKMDRVIVEPVNTEECNDAW